jgi:hypothetical protein
MGWRKTLPPARLSHLTVTLVPWRIGRDADISAKTEGAHDPHDDHT